MVQPRSVLLLLIVFSLCFSQKTADFLILEKPQNYAILDEYQQQLGESGRLEFVSGTPLQIISNDMLLGDQITHALQGSFEGKMWYLQKDDAKNLIGAAVKEIPRICKGCEIGYDTVEIIRENAVGFSANAGAVGIGEIFLNRQEKVIRIFRYRDQWYVRRSGRFVRYGWSRFPVSGPWRHVVAISAADTGISDYLQNKIIDRFRSANETYRQYFEHFNSVSGKEKTVPVWRWSVHPREKAVFFLLSPAYGTKDLLGESTRYLERDLENMLIGKRYDVICEKGGIIVKPKDTSAQ